MNKRVIGIIVGIILAATGFFYLTQPAKEGSAQLTNHVLGEGSTGVVLIEYGDFQCPACKAYHPILLQVKARYNKEITFQFRNFPLESIHKNARAAARAAEAADIQGKFWDMHDLLYERQDEWKDTSDPISKFEDYARTIGVADLDKFSKDYKSSYVNDLISADLAEGRKLGALSTPTFILDGVKLEDNPSASAQSFGLLIEEAIAKKTGQPLPEQTTDDQGLPPVETTPGPETTE